MFTWSQMPSFGMRYITACGSKYRLNVLPLLATKLSDFQFSATHLAQRTSSFFNSNSITASARFWVFNMPPVAWARISPCNSSSLAQRQAYLLSLLLADPSTWARISSRIEPSSTRRTQIMSAR